MEVGEKDEGKCLSKIHICACAEATIRSEAIIFIGDFLHGNLNNPENCHRIRMKNAVLWLFQGFYVLQVHQSGSNDFRREPKKIHTIFKK